MSIGNQEGFRLPDVPCAPLLVFQGTFQGNYAKILKDDGCNTNVVSRDFIEQHRNNLRLSPKLMNITHSKGDSNEISMECLQGTVQIGDYKYTSQWFVADYHYDVLLGMPWNVQAKPRVDYGNRTVEV